MGKTIELMNFNCVHKDANKTYLPEIMMELSKVSIKNKDYDNLRVIRDNCLPSIAFQNKDNYKGMDNVSTFLDNVISSVDIENQRNEEVEYSKTR